jgi:signal transduction histidine kinase
LTGSRDAPDEALLGLNRLATVARLMSGAAHEVNNALQVISGTVEILESRADMPATFREALARLRQQSSRAAAALAHVQLFTRAARGESAPVNVRELVEESVALRDFAARRAGLSIRFEAEPHAFIVTGSRGDLQQAVLNLMMNAEQALRASGGSITVRLALDDGAVVVSVIDEGPGVAVDPPARAFEPFVTMRDAYESAGLGLWAARVIVEAHGGVLTLERRDGATVAAIRLPAGSGRGK